MSNPFILESQLNEYADKALYPLHMPGHKRRLAPSPDLAPLTRWDMTEVPGVDDLHEAEGILADAMARTARLHGAARTWYLINGSTCGLLAGIRTFAKQGATILAARNCHKAVYHAAELGDLKVHWLTPPIDPEFGVYGSLSPRQVQKALDEVPNAACLVLTSPTYEGVLSDIQTIAELCHQKGVPLLVDEAHGAHLGLFEGWPQSAVRLGADLVVQSAHKTLPSLTQTALLHLGKGSLADPEEVERQLDIFETSSPSYPLLVSLDGCTGILREQGAELFRQWRQNLAQFSDAVRPLKNLRVLCHGEDRKNLHPDIFDFDPSKLAVSTAGTDFTGTGLAQVLRGEFGFETEMACGPITLAMTGASDDPEAILRFAKVLLELDARAGKGPILAPLVLPKPGKAAFSIGTALLKPARDLPLADAAEQVSAEYIWAYPPGVPLIAPGEIVGPEFAAAAAALTQSGTALHHSHCKKPGSIHVLA